MSYQVSRSTAQEAVRMLAVQGLVRIKAVSAVARS